MGREKNEREILRDFMTEPIDVVVTWVDGDDPIHKRKREAFLSGKGEENFDDIAGATRFRSLGEIDFCVGSILRFAPFVRKIYIVTDNQNPHLEDFIDYNFPDNRIPVEIVDHKVIFRGYEQYLPTFNSLSIETMLYRIPGLSEHFVYFNDDFLLAAPVSPEDWVVGGKPVLYGYWHNTVTARICRMLSRLKKGHSTFKFRDSMLNAADVLGGKADWRFFRIVHSPLVMKKSLCESFYKAKPELLIKNIRYRFRDKSQFNPQTLFQTIMAYSGECVIRSNRDSVLYMKPEPDRPDKFEKYRKDMEENKSAKFCCINSLDQGTAEQQQFILSWVEDRLSVSLDCGRKHSVHTA